MTKCQHCDAEVLSTSQPNRMGTTPEMQKMYDEFGGDDDEQIAMAMYDWQYGAGAWASSQSHLKDHFIGLARAALAALAATPAVGGEALDRAAFQLFLLDNNASRWPSVNQDHYRKEAKSILDAASFAAQPASPLRGRPPLEPTEEMVRAAYRDQPNSINVGFAQAYRVMVAASPPEQPTAEPVTWRELLASAWMLGHGRARGITFEEMAADIGKGSFLWGQAMMDAVALSPTAPDKDAAPHYPSFAELNLIDRFGRKDRK